MAPKAKASKDVAAAPKKEKKAKEAAGFMGWDDADDDAEQSGGFKQGKIAAPLDKRGKQAEVKEDKIITGGSDAASMLLKKQAAVKKDDKAKKAADQKVKDSVKAERQAGDGLGGDGDDGDGGDAFQILDKSGLGNFMDKADVLDIMKNTVSEAVTSSGSRSQVVTKITEGDRVYLGDDKKAPVFESMGGFKTNKGFVYIRGKRDEPGFGVKFVRSCTMYVCLSEPPNEDDSYMRRWDVVSPDDLTPPDVGDGLAEIAIVRKKKFTDRMGSVPKPPEGYETCLCFIVPDFHAEPFGKEELSKEEQLALDRKNKALSRDEKDKDKAEKDKGKADKKKDEPSEEEIIEAIKEKVAAGTKLTSKEKKALEKWNEKHPTYEVHAEDRSLVDSSLNAFSVVIEGGCNPPPAGDSLVVDSFSLQAPGQHLFVNASFTIAQGKRYGILGPNGQGKTTLLRHIAAREFPVPLNWDVILVEQEAKASNKSAVEEVMASNEAMFRLNQLEQELIDKLDKASEAAEKGEEAMSAAECETVQQELSRVSAELEASGADSAEAAVRKILCGLGFTNGGGKVGSVTDRFSMDRPVEQFSGGWRMRISLAKALYLCPKLLMLDEPTNHLDLDAVLWLDDYLSTKYPHAVIVVSHDADFLDHIVTDILHLENKQLLHYRGDYSAFRKMHAQKARETASIYKKQQDEIKLLKKKGANKDDAEAKVKQKYHINSLDDLMEKPKDYLVKFNFRGHGMDQSIGGVNVTEVAFSYNGKEPWLLEDCEMGVDCASRIAIVGPNGAGKTTMLNLMLMQLEPSKGEVQISKGLRVKNYHQHFEELLPFEKDPTTHLRSMYNLNPERARAVLGQFGLPGASHHTKIGNLSGGQKARVAFGELMLSEPHIMILDEPTNHLDIESVEALTKAISNFDGGLVLVSHDARLITEIDAEIWVVEEGTCYRFEKGFEGYRDKVLKQLEERQKEVERLEAKRREVKAAKRAALVTAEQAALAKKRAEEEKKKEDDKQAELLKKAQADAAVALANKPKKKEVVDDPIEEGSDEDEEEAKKDAGKGESDDDSEKGSDKDDSEDEEDIDYNEKHDEFKVAMLVSVRVKKVNVGKKDKEFKVFLCELDIGEDDNISAVTMYANAMAGEKVIVALVGSTVEDAKVEAEMVHGEYNQALICGPKEMSWTVPKGEANKCAILDDSFEVGDFAPKRIKFAKDSEDGEGQDNVGGDKADAKAVPQKKKDAPSASADAKSKKGKKADDGDDDDDDDDAPKGPVGDAEQDKKKKKGKPGKGEDDVKVGRSAAKKVQAEKGEAEKKEKAEAAAKAKGKKGKNQVIDDEDDVPIEKVKGKKDAPEAVKQDAPAGDPNAKHPEYKVAKVIAAEPQKKGGKFIRGSFVISISLGDDAGGDDITVITPNDLAPGNRVVFAPEGSTVSGKEVKKQKVQGEWTFGVFCTAFDLSWPGDAGRCVLLSDAWTVGDFVPLNAPKDLGVVAVDEPDEDEMSEGAKDEEEDEVDYAEVNDGKKKGAAKAAPKAKGKAAKGKKGKKGDVDSDEDQDDDVAGAKAKAKAEPKPKGAPPAPKAKAKGKKGKKGDSDEEFVKKDVPVAVAKKVPAKKVDSDSDDAPPPARKGGFAKAGFSAMLDSDDENADSESEEEVKPPPKKEPLAPIAKAKSKKDESGDSESDDDDKAAKKKAAAKEKEKAKAKKKKAESSDEESSDEDEKKAAVARKKAMEKLKEKAKGKKKKASSSDDESSEDDKAKKKKAKAKAKKKKESSSDEESSEDEKAKKKKAAAKEKEKAKAKKKKESSSDEESSEDEKAKKKKAAAKEKEKAEKSKAKKKKDDSDDEGAAFDFGDKKKKDKKKKADDDSDDDKKKKKEKKDKK